jgi:hypothetical protein
MKRFPWNHSHTVFLGIWLFIAVVSVHDGYLMAIHRSVHRQSGLEQNPVANYLIVVQGGRVWLLLAAKACGTVTACALLLVLYRWRRRIAWVVAISIAALQLVLLVYLLTA